MKIPNTVYVYARYDTYAHFDEDPERNIALSVEDSYVNLTVEEAKKFRKILNKAIKKSQAAKKEGK